MRRPISRVRSVTETSRIFMMPMPPTTSEIEATMASRIAMTRLLPSAVSAIWLRLRMSKSFMSVGLMRWRRVSVCVDLAIAVSTCPGRRLNIDRVDVAGEARRADCTDSAAAIERQLFCVCWLGRRRDAEDFLLAGRKRNHHEIVLVLAECVWPLAASTPTTRSGTSLLTRMVAPSGFSPSLNNCR